MGLIAHFPLIKDSNDTLHHGNLIDSSTLVDDGALGKCLELSKASKTLTFNELKGKKTFTLSYWIKFDTTTWGRFDDIWRAYIQYDNSGMDDNQFRQEVSGFEASTTDIEVSIFANSFWCNDGSLGYKTITRNEWHHFVVSVFYDKVVSYIDGVQDTSINKILTYPNSNVATFNGRIVFNPNNRPYYIWDIKIFDEPISNREARELYKTCVLDYSFSNPMLNYKNLYPGTQYSVANMSVQYNVATDVFKDYGFSTATKFIPNDNTEAKLSYSYLVNTDFLTTNGFDETTKIGFSFYAYATEDLDADITMKTEGDVVFDRKFVSYGDSGVDSYHITSTAKGKVVLFYGEIHDPSPEKFNIMFYFNEHKTNTFTKGYVLVTGLSLYKLNDGDDFIPPSYFIGTSPNYGKLKDASGFGNHPTESPTNINLTRDTVYGHYAYSTGNDGTSFKFPFPLKTTNYNGSVEFWVKLKSNHPYAAIVWNRNSKFWIALNCEGHALWFYNNTYYRSNAKSLSLNIWHHCALVFSGQNLSLYIDGKLDNTITNNINFDVSSTTCYFGGDENSSDKWDTRLDANIANLKFFATPLSAEDVANDAKQRISLAKTGSIIGSNFVEHDDLSKTKMSKGGEIITKNLDEVSAYDMKGMTLSDGSRWVRIFHHETPNGNNLFSSSEGPLVRNEDNTKFSLLYLLDRDEYRNSDGEYEFYLEYPIEAPGKYNRWKQTSNPTKANPVTGYSAIHVDWTNSTWGGLRLGSLTGGNTFINGSTDGGWFYAIGCRSKWSTSIPGPSFASTVVNLYVRVYDDHYQEEYDESKHKLGKTFMTAYSYDEI